MAKVTFDPTKSEFPGDERRAYDTRKGRIHLEPGDNNVEDRILPYLLKNKSFAAAIERGEVTIPETLPLDKPVIESVIVEKTDQDG